MENERSQILDGVREIVVQELEPIKQELHHVSDSLYNLHLKLGALQERYDDITVKHETLGYQLIGITKSQSELLHQKQVIYGKVLNNLVSSINCLPATISEHLKLNGASNGDHNTSNNLLNTGTIHVDEDLIQVETRAEAMTNHVTKTTQKISTLVESNEEENSGPSFSEKHNNFSNNEFLPHLPPEMIHQSAAAFNNKKTVNVNEHNNFTELNPQAVSLCENGILNITQNKSVSHQLPSEINCPSEVALDHQTTASENTIETVDTSQHMVSLPIQNIISSCYRINVINDSLQDASRTAILSSEDPSSRVSLPPMQNDLPGLSSDLNTTVCPEAPYRNSKNDTYGSNVITNQCNISLPLQLPHTSGTAPNIQSGADDKEIQKQLEQKEKDEVRRFYKNKFNYLKKESIANQNSNVEKNLKRKISDIEGEKRLQVVLMPLDQHDVTSELKNNGVGPDEMYKYYYTKLFKK